MSVQKMKALAHQYIDEVKDEELLEEVIRLLYQDVNELKEPAMLYLSGAANKELDEADAEIDRDESYTHEEAIEILRNRSGKKQ